MAFTPQRVDDRHPEANGRYGTVVSTTNSTLVTLTDCGRTQTHSVVEHSRVLQRGKACRLAEIAAGSRVRITPRIRDQGVASEVECLRYPGSS
jgi:RNase P/RNase MRP subunit p29